MLEMGSYNQMMYEFYDPDFHASSEEVKESFDELRFLTSLFMDYVSFFLS